MAGLSTPILGVNIGGLGFLTAMPSSKIVAQLPRLFSRDLVIEERSLLQARGQTAGQEFSQVALNDFVISRGATSRLVDLQVRIDGEPLTNYRCDGLIALPPRARRPIRSRLGELL